MVGKPGQPGFGKGRWGKAVNKGPLLRGVPALYTPHLCTSPSPILGGCGRPPMPWGLSVGAPYTDYMGRSPAEQGAASEEENGPRVGVAGSPWAPTPSCG